ncbi:radical SAM protein [Candidatus Bathyarchaeota archaeon]|nr:MAG: radical SAM protein [Candidatus Bathyarchaeota archaeon]
MSKLQESPEFDEIKVLEETLSVDDTKKIPTPIRAKYVLEGDVVYLHKDNGTKERIGSLEYWNRVKKFQTHKRVRLNTTIEHKKDVLSCGLCDQHKNSTALLNIVLTNRCNLRCWYCFFYAERVGFVYEPTIEEIGKMIEVATRVNGYAPPIQLTGGEPTLREDLPEVIKLCKDMGSPHVQLNINSVEPGIKYYLDPKAAVKEVRKWKEAGLNTIYTSFDGIDPKINFKNHYETPFALEVYSKAGINSTVLVPTVFKDNLKEVQKIVKFAAMHTDKGVKGVNFQPISIVGNTPKEREKLRVTQSDVIDELKVFGLKTADWFSIPAVDVLADIIGGGKENHVHFYNNEKCGVASYAYVDGDKLYPITDFIDADKFLEDLHKVDKNILHKASFALSLVPKMIQTRDRRKSLVKKIHKYIVKDELPNGIRISNMLDEIVEKGNYSTLGEFHQYFLFFGMMHFMDPYNYDINRVQRCCIHYGSPDGRVIPFCTYNVFPEIYRDAILKENRVKETKLEGKLKKEEKKKARDVAEFRHMIKEVKNSDLYKSYYRGLL